MTTAYRLAAVLFFGVVAWVLGMVCADQFYAGAGIMLLLPGAATIIGGIALITGIVND